MAIAGVCINTSGLEGVLCTAFLAGVLISPCFVSGALLFCAALFCTTFVALPSAFPNIWLKDFVSGEKKPAFTAAFKFSFLILKTLPLSNRTAKASSATSRRKTVPGIPDKAGGDLRTTCWPGEKTSSSLSFFFILEACWAGLADVFFASVFILSILTAAGAGVGFPISAVSTLGVGTQLCFCLEDQRPSHASFTVKVSWIFSVLMLKTLPLSMRTATASPFTRRTIVPVFPFRAGGDLRRTRVPSEKTSLFLWAKRPTMDFRKLG
mmetsp:Transcript_4782/g.8493  ORF Transcript_4782/g.8493 Transcript_4782/m.8493 type:complete len:266 (-) Transcript_4782:198-995(-)